MKQCKKFKPYIRLANGREKSESFRMALRLAFYQSRKRPFYVMVQRGFPNHVIEVGISKRHIAQSIVVVSAGRMSFNAWASKIQKKSVVKRDRSRT